jgi:uncharacterized protein (DUF1778 family)
MPTAKPRVQVTVTESQHHLLRRLAKLQGRSMSAVLAELLEEIAPVLERVAVVMQAAERAQASVREGLRTSAEQAEEQVRPLMAQALAQFDWLAQQIEPKGSAERGAAQPHAPATPEPVTRGSENRNPMISHRTRSGAFRLRKKAVKHAGRRAHK